MPFTSKIIALTGAASGIGLSTAKTLARLGATLSLADSNPSKLQSAHTALASISSPEKVFSTHLDIRSSTAVDSWISSTLEKFPGRRLDGAANIAGFHPLWAPKPLCEIEDGEFEECIGVNTLGLFYCLRAQLRPDVMASPGSIVNVGSVSGLMGFAGDSAYVASKHAVHGMTKSVAKEVGPRGIRVNAVAPGQINTPMVRIMESEGKGVLPTPKVPLEREGQPEEIAELIVWLLGEKSSYVTGGVYRIDGGMLE